MPSQYVNQYWPHSLSRVIMYVRHVIGQLYLYGSHPRDSYSFHIASGEVNYCSRNFGKRQGSDFHIFSPLMPRNTNTRVRSPSRNRTWLCCISGVLSTKAPSRSNELTDWNGKLDYIKLHQIGVGLVTVMPGEMSVNCCTRMHMKTCLHTCANSQ